MTWQDKIRNAQCSLCPLHEGAEYVCLMGTGSRKSRIVIVGEAPGAREDETHQAFVGAAGQLLTSLLEDVGISRADCYITNAVKCRPVGNATPSRAEAKVCSNTYLTEEILRVEPTHLLSLGNTALQVTTGRSGITKYRGRTFPLGDCVVLPTFHPAAALRSPKYLPTIKADFAAFARLVDGAPSEGPTTKVKVVRTPAQLNWLIKQITDAPVVAFDLETTGLEEWHSDSQIVTLGLSWGAGTAAVVPIHHPERRGMAPSQVLRRLKPVLEGHPKLVAHNAKFDARWLASAGIFVDVKFDTMLAAHMLDENNAKGLKPLSQLHLGANDYDIGDEVKKAQEVPLKRLAIYNGKDCDYTFRLRELFKPNLAEEPRVTRLFAKLVMPASNALTRIERGGIWVDEQRLNERTNRAQQVLKQLTAYMDVSSGGINYNSPQQVALWLFGELGLPILEETNTGNPSTREGVLLSLESESRYVKALLKYRKWHKWLTTYLLPWGEHRDERSRIHTSYLLHGTVTGRLSSRGPNLQQVPRDPFIRGILGASPGWVFVEADYSQVELRIAAMLANERTMLRVLNSGADLHTSTAVSILRKLPEDITKDERVIWGKHPNFGLVFGMGPGTEGKKGGYRDYCWNNGIEISYEDARRVYNRFHETYPGLRAWHERQKRLADRYGRVQNALGRVRHLPDMQSSDQSVRAEAERQAINSPVQSVASDLMLVSLVRLAASLPSRVARIIGTTHDQLMFEIRDSYVDEIAPLIRDTMQDMDYVEKVFGATMSVPIIAEVEAGTHWGETVPWHPGLNYTRNTD
jgi:uracil-DNA glycosylase family 4